MSKHERHEHYNHDNFPVFIVNHGNWDVYMNTRNHCAAIPAPDSSPGCKASYFGDLEYVRCTLGDILPDRWKGPLIRHSVKR